jgi:hypothetical protein
LHTNIDQQWKTDEQIVTFTGTVIVVTMLGNAINYISHEGVVIMLGKAI